MLSTLVADVVADVVAGILCLCVVHYVVIITARVVYMLFFVVSLL